MMSTACITTDIQQLRHPGLLCGLIREHQAAPQAPNHVTCEMSALQGVHRRHGSRLVAHRQNEQPQ